MYSEENISTVELSKYTPNVTTSNSSYSALIDNDTIDSRYYNDRRGFLAYLNDSNYYNQDMRRAESNDRVNNSYGWCSESGISHQYGDTVEINLEVYLYSSTSRDPAATYAFLTQGTVAVSFFGFDTLDQGTAPNGWNSLYGTKTIYDNGYLIGIQVTPSGRGSTYTGADAVDFTFSII